MLKTREQNAIIGQIAKVLNWKEWMREGVDRCTQYHNKLDKVTIQVPEKARQIKQKEIEEGKWGESK